MAPWKISSLAWAPEWLADAWAAEHGLAFAACAVVELSAFDLVWSAEGTAPTARPRSDDDIRITCERRRAR